MSNLLKVNNINDNWQKSLDKSSLWVSTMI